ncbi:RNA-directed DNA polymerase [Kluyvera intermedia]|uniref:RNA-directed DNA polymerase n=1 Tax=Kluyvera intermedia TaxID=61648 RepID=UPI0035265469
MIINKIYKNIQPKGSFIVDEVILINAWKKSQQYIRSVSWYVDYLDLDRSAVELEIRIEQLQRKVSKKKYVPRALELIPAPKAKKWSFQMNGDDDSKERIWRPEDFHKRKKTNEIIQPLRPLAHISIDDQTLYTALMMLMANKVETLQSDPSLSYENVHAAKLINYGNRLHCSYKNSLAFYSWGNSAVYSKFFKDYQRFLNRPKFFGKKAARLKKDDERIYEVQLDFSKFYDSIDRDKLVLKIKELICSITSEKKIDPIIESILVQFKNWEWTESSCLLYKSTCANDIVPDLKIGKGIPQGLVAGGFFANIYMLDFDAYISDVIGSGLDDNNTIILVDACRYVDDLRLIIKCKNTHDENSILSAIYAKLSSIIEELSLHFQSKKTKIKIFNHKVDAISTKLSDIQDKVSGPLTMSELDEQLGHLEGLVELSDNLNFEINDDVNKNINSLERIDKTFVDLRKDSLLRFSANKIHSLLVQKRHMVAQDVDNNGRIIPGSWDYLQERMARKLLSKWTSDPSLVLLLKKSLEMFPHASLLHPVLKNINDLISLDNSKDLVCLAEYCLCEILRHSATEIYSKNRWGYPAHSDVDGYFDILTNFVLDKFKSKDKIGGHLREQILFYCLVINDSPLKIETKNGMFDLITQMINGFRNINDNINGYEYLTAIILANQFSKDKDKVIRSVNSFLEDLSNGKIVSKSRLTNRKLSYFVTDNSVNNLCRSIMIEDYDLFESVFLSARKQKLKWISKIQDIIDYFSLESKAGFKGSLGIYNGIDIPLLSVLRSEQNPFIHENAILKLIESVFSSLNGLNIKKPIDISGCIINCSDWRKVLRLEESCKLTIEISFYKDNVFPLHQLPPWVTDEHKPLYYLGMFIRSCLLGRIDWSYTPKLDYCNNGYKGITTNLLKRQVGMINSPEIFGGYKTCITGWLSSFVFHLLQWPGLDIKADDLKLDGELTLDNIDKIVLNRLNEQKKNYCRLADIPSYTERVDLGWPLNKKDMTVIMVQSLLPKVDDFQINNLKLCEPKYRSKHRRHVASVAELILHNISAMDSKNDSPILKGKVDIIIWPELSISKDDIDILQRLCDKTGAMIFAGMVFDHIANNQELNNAAIWLIPNKSGAGRRFVKRYQGKWNMTLSEKGAITPWRPYQLFIELIHPLYPEKEGFKLTGSICYDSTDIKLNADLKNKSDAYIISAMNKDVSTFDNMVNALFYHMYQYVVLVNSGEFGGSVAKAPYKEPFDRLITHVHGVNQVSLSFFEMNMFDFRDEYVMLKSNKFLKTRPAGDNL